MDPQEEVVDWIEEGAFFLVPAPRALGLVSMQDEVEEAEEIMTAIKELRPDLTVIEFKEPFEPNFYNNLPPQVWGERYVVMFIPSDVMPPIPDYPIVYSFDGYGL